MMIMMTMMMLLMKETSSMVSGNLVFRVSGRERTSKPDMRHKLMNILVMRLIMRLMMKLVMRLMMITLMMITLMLALMMMNLPKVRKGMRAGEEGTRRSPSRRT